MALHSLERKVLRACRALLTPSSFDGGMGLVVGLSGGPDSTALLAALAALSRDGRLGAFDGKLGAAPLIAAHLDHGLRGAEARRDRDAAEAIAARLGATFRDGVADTHEEARRRGSGSLEAAARAVRYAFLAGVARECGAARVAVAHTADDQAETVLLRALRGTGLAGLGGMPRRRALDERVTLVRPLLRVTRAEVEAYLREAGLAGLVVADGSNQDPRFLRNRLRGEVLPVLRDRVNPRVGDALLRLAEQARRARKHLDRAAAALLAEAETASGWALAPLRAADPAVRGQALARLVSSTAPDRAAAEHVRLLERAVRRGRGKCDLPGGLRLEVAGERLVAVSRVPSPLPAETGLSLPLSVPGEVHDPVSGLLFAARVRDAAEPDREQDPARVAWLDAAQVRGLVQVRRRREGDRFWPLGAPGTKTLKRFLIDRKVPRDERARTPVVTLDDQPVWIVGHRIDERFKVTPATRAVLELRATPAHGEKGLAS